MGALGAGVFVVVIERYQVGRRYAIIRRWLQAQIACPVRSNGAAKPRRRIPIRTDELSFGQARTLPTDPPDSLHDCRTQGSLALSAPVLLTLDGH